MNPQQKAACIITRYYNLTFLNVREQIRKCALIAVEEVISSIPADQYWYEVKMQYWQEVKKEIIKL